MATNSTEQLHHIEALATFGLIDRVVPNSDEDLMIKLKNSYVQINSLNKIIELCQAIDGLLTSRDTAIMREWVTITKNLHPDVTTAISDFVHFKPISEEVGSRVLGYSQDTQSQRLDNWGSGDTTLIRKNLVLKLNSDQSAIITKSYQELSKRLAVGLPKEFYEDYKDIGTARSLQGRDPLGAHDFHLSGDITYRRVIDRITSDVKSSIVGYLADAIRLINYIYPINISATSTNEQLNIVVEGNNITVNLKKEMVTDVINKINNKVLRPEEII